MGSVLTPTAAMIALAGADIAVATPSECSELLGHARLMRGWLDSVEAKVTSRVTEHHAAGQSAPAADTHTACGGVSAAEGKRKERRSKTINDAPQFGEALAEGGIGAEHVDALASATSRLDESVKAALLGQDDLLDVARSQTPEKFGQTVRDRARTLEADNGIERNRQQRKQTFLSHKINHETGMHEGRFAFHPELGSRIFSAIDRQVLKNIKAGTARGEAEFVNRTFDYPQQAAEALGDIVGNMNTNTPTTPPPQTPTTIYTDADASECRGIEADITVIIDYQTALTGQFHGHSVCETSDGAILPPASVQRLLCNGSITPVIVDSSGNPFNLGRTVRHASRKQRRALRAIYRTCGFPGCDVGFWKCEIHHILPWELGGATDLANMMPMCSRHHHVIHEGGWQLHLTPNRTLTVTQPNGQRFGTATPDMNRQTSQDLLAPTGALSPHHQRRPRTIRGRCPARPTPCRWPGDPPGQMNRNETRSS